MTFRTSAEGGEATITPDAYARLYATALRHGGPDMIDLEFALCAHPAVAAAFHQARAAGKPVVTSYHNFHETRPLPPWSTSCSQCRALAPTSPRSP
jgi:3-dehydroquinate dehydratase type I